MRSDPTGVLVLLVLACAPARSAAQGLEPLSSFEAPEVGGGRVLTLDDVLESVARHHPEIEIAEARARAASGARLSAEGGFDPVVSATAYAAPIGYYTYGRADVTISQPTPLWGASFLGGWRIGRGVERGGIPDYYGFYETLDGGELRAGATLPLWRDGPIDARRAAIERGERGEDAAFLERDARVLRAQLAGVEAYLRWAAAGMRLRVANQLLEIAAERDRQIASRVVAGAIAQFEHLENRRAILERRQSVITSRRALERAAIQLSLFSRDDAGSPRVATPEELPPQIALGATSDEPEDTLVARALSSRPELARFGALLGRSRVDIALAENQIAPRIDVSVLGSFDLGGGAASLADQNRLGLPVLETWLQFSLPLGMREARGRADAARGELDAVLAEQELATDRVVIEVRDALSAVRAARDAWAVAEESAAAAEAVERGERRRFEEGATTLLVVNLREMAAAQARASLIDARVELAYSLAWLRVATGAPPSER